MPGISCSRARQVSSIRGRSAPTSSPMSRASTEVHHVHVWSITQSRRMVTLHACIGETDNSDAIVKSIKARLKERFGLDHATVEIERGVCADVRLLRHEGMNETPLIAVEDLSVDFRSGERRHPCRQERVVRYRPRRDGGAGRRVGLGQDGDGAVDPQAPPLPFRLAPFGQDPVQRREPAVAAASGACARSGATRSP